MKIRTIFLVISTFVLMGANAQNEEQIYKPTAGSHNFELLFDPGSIFGSNNNGTFKLYDDIIGNPVIDEDGYDYSSLMNGIKYRYFVTDQNVFRLKFNYTLVSLTDPDNYEDDSSIKTSLSAFSIMPGFEKHFRGTSRMSPYIGAQAIASVFSTKIKEKTGNKTDVTKNSTGEEFYQLGLGVVAGFDYYFAKNLYLGLEFDYSLFYTRPLNQQDDDYESDDNKTSYLINIIPSATAIFRLGWCFGGK